MPADDYSRRRTHLPGWESPPAKRAQINLDSMDDTDDSIYDEYGKEQSDSMDKGASCK